MALHQTDIEQADLNLTSIVTILTYTPTTSGWYTGLIKFGNGIKNLSAVGGFFQFVITVGGYTVQPSPQVVTFSTDVRSMIWTVPFPAIAGDEVIIQVLSPNVEDSDVNVTAYLVDMTLGANTPGTISG